MRWAEDYPAMTELTWAFYPDTEEELKFRAHGLPVIAWLNDQTHTFRWLLEVKEALWHELTNYPDSYYSLLARVYKDRSLQVAAKSLLSLWGAAELTDDTFELDAALKQLVEEAGVQ